MSLIDFSFVAKVGQEMKIIAALTSSLIIFAQTWPWTADAAATVKKCGKPFFAQLSPNCKLFLGPKLGPKVEELFIQEAESDEFGPLIYNDEFEVIGHEGEQKMVLLDDLLAKRYESTVFALKDEEKIIKYQANCQLGSDDLSIHPLVREYLMLKMIEPLGISPRVEFLSVPIKFGFSPISRKVDFGMSLEKRLECADNPSTSLRFMVMDRALYSLDAFMRVAEKRGERIPFIKGIKIIRGALIGLSKLHQQRIIHGDVHYGNLVLLDSKRVGLIDFGAAMHASEFSILDEQTIPPSYHCYLSHWNLDGYRFSYRDDVYKAFFAGAMILNGSPFVESFCNDSIQHDKEVQQMLYDFKANSFLFSLPNSSEESDLVSQIPDITQDQKIEIRNRLKHAIALVRSVEPIDAFPRYRYILEELDAVIAILKPPSSV